MTDPPIHVNTHKVKTLINTMWKGSLDKEPAKAVQTLRDVLNLTQCELAQHLSVSETTVQRWERGLCAPAKRNRDALSQLWLQNIAYAEHHTASALIPVEQKPSMAVRLAQDPRFIEALKLLLSLLFLIFQNILITHFT